MNVGRVPLAIGALWLLLAACSRGDDLLTSAGYGKVRFGAPVSDAERALGERLVPAVHESPCVMVRFSAYPGVTFMAEQGVVTRADAGAAIPNSAKVVVGMSLQQVLALHPGIEVRPHKYQENAHYLVLDGEAPDTAFVFEEIDGKVSAVRAGRRPAVDYVEGCS